VMRCLDDYLRGRRHPLGTVAALGLGDARQIADLADLTVVNL